MLRKVGEKILHEDLNIYFLIAGKEEPLKGINNDRWIEAGWTNDPHSLIAAADVFVLPNKETYFDIVMLEVLSLGKIVVASNTGGNKYFRKINAEGIFLYNSINEAISLINRVKDMPGEEKARLEQINKRLFNEKFTSEIFCNNYIELLNELK
jgi:glycosyltransferase involved in cell wall biosynthesis